MPLMYCTSQNGRSLTCCWISLGPEFSAMFYWSLWSWYPAQHFWSCHKLGPWRISMQTWVGCWHPIKSWYSICTSKRGIQTGGRSMLMRLISVCLLSVNLLYLRHQTTLPLKVRYKADSLCTISADTDNGTGVDPAEYLGSFYKFDEPLVFPSSLFSGELAEDSTQIRIKSPGADRSGNDRWSRIVRHRYGLVVRGVLKYRAFPLGGLYPQSAAICDVVHVEPTSGTVDEDPDQSFCFKDKLWMGNIFVESVVLQEI